MGMCKSQQHSKNYLSLLQSTTYTLKKLFLFYYNSQSLHSQLKMEIWWKWQTPTQQLFYKSGVGIEEIVQDFSF